MERLQHTHSDDTTELLSAYTDDAVDVVERRRVEEFAQSCPACAQELRELRLFKQVMHDLPNIQPRRSFTIDPATVPRPRWLLFPTLRFASLASALLLLIVLGIDGFSAMGGAQPTSASVSMRGVEAQEGFGGDTGAAGAVPQSAAGTGAAASAAASTAASAAASAAAKAVVPQSPITEASAAAVVEASTAAGGEGTTAAGAGTTADDASATGGSAADVVPNPAPMPTMITLNTAAAYPPADALSQQPAANSAAQAASAPAAAGGTGADSQLRTNQPAGIDTEGLSTVEQQDQANGRSPVDTLLIIEVVLGITALAFGIGAYLAWRRKL